MDDLELLAQLKIQLQRLDNKINRVGIGSTERSKGSIRSFEANYQSLTIEKREIESRIYELEEKLKDAR